MRCGFRLLIFIRCDAAWYKTHGTVPAPYHLLDFKDSRPTVRFGAEFFRFDAPAVRCDAVC